MVSVIKSILWRIDPLLGKDLETTTRQQTLLCNSTVNTPYNNRVTVPPERWLTFGGLHDVISQKIGLFIKLFVYRFA
jgi:hypothetical protein